MNAHVLYTNEGSTQRNLNRKAYKSEWANKSVCLECGQKLTIRRRRRKSRRSKSNQLGIIVRDNIANVSQRESDCARASGRIGR